MHERVIIMVAVVCSRTRLKLLSKKQKKKILNQKTARPETSTLAVSLWIIFVFWSMETPLQYILEYCRVLLSDSLVWKAEPHLARWGIYSY